MHSNIFNSAKYLGVQLNSNSRDDDHMLRHLRTFYAKSNAILRKFHYCYSDVKLLLFQSYYMPAYCSHLWANYSQSTYCKLRIAFNKVHRRIMDYGKRESASNMYVINNIDCFNVFIRKNIQGFIKRVCAIENELVQNVLLLLN